jgi:hypothetical protein
MTTILARGSAYQLRPEPYWHLCLKQGGNILHNAHNGEGICASNSAIRQLPGMEDAVSLYGFGAAATEKEQVWEAARVAVNAQAPTRLHAMFLIDDEAIAFRAMETWFAGQERHLLLARIDRRAKTHRADAKWLDHGRSEWEESASCYWRGEMTADPMPEIIVEGVVYFPGWRNAPFGLFAGLFRSPPP